MAKAIGIGAGNAVGGPAGRVYGSQAKLNTGIGSQFLKSNQRFKGIGVPAPVILV